LGRMCLLGTMLIGADALYIRPANLTVSYLPEAGSHLTSHRQKQMAWWRSDHCHHYPSQPNHWSWPKINGLHNSGDAAWLDLAVVACSIVEFGRMVRFGCEGMQLVDLAVASLVLVNGSGGFIVGQ